MPGTKNQFPLFGHRDRFLWPAVLGPLAVSNLYKHRDMDPTGSVSHHEVYLAAPTAIVSAEQLQSMISKVSFGEIFAPMDGHGRINANCRWLDAGRRAGR
jgi:hypothetical protein